MRLPAKTNLCITQSMAHAIMYPNAVFWNCFVNNEFACMIMADNETETVSTKQGDVGVPVFDH